MNALSKPSEGRRGGQGREVCCPPTWRFGVRQPGFICPPTWSFCCPPSVPPLRSKSAQKGLMTSCIKTTEHPFYEGANEAYYELPPKAIPMPATRSC